MKKEDYFKYYIQGTDHYLIPKDVFDELFEEMENWKEEAKELKKRLEEKENIACDWKDSCLENVGKIEILENQQKEFIEYLEREEDRLASECSHVYEDSLGKTRLVNEDIFNEVDKILSKYQEIIGKDINVTTKGDKDDK